MDNVKTLMSHLIKNPHDINSCSFLQDILRNEDYVIYFYLINNYGEGLGMNRDLLSMSLDVNASVWVDEKSKLFRENKMNLDYIRMNVDDALLSPTDYANAFKQLVLNRYDELDKMSNDNFNLQDSMPLIREYAETELGKNLLSEVIELVRGGKWHKGKKYLPTQIIPFLRTRMEEMEMNSTQSTDNDSYGTQISNSFARGAMAYSQCFEWNLGQNIKLPTVNRGYVVSVIGQEKVGKTKFALGEMAYNTIRAGGNVLCYSGEMSDVIIRTILVIKHVYATIGYKLDNKKVLAFLSVHFMFLEENITYEQYEKEMSRRKDIRNGKIDEIDTPYVSAETMSRLRAIGPTMKTYKTVEDVEREVILSAYDDLYLSGKYGQFIIYKQEDGVFDVDTLLPTTKANVAKHNAWMWILDHAGFVESSSGLGKVEIFTNTYQKAKAIAENPDHPVTSVVINHIDTKSNTDIRSGKDGGHQSMRAHGSSEARKSADIEIALFASPEDSREGLVKVMTTVSRHESGLTVPAALISDLAVNDFVGIGSSKVPYPEGQEDDF